MAVKTNLTIIMKNHAADPEIWFLGKLIPKSDGFATVMPTAWELSFRETKVSVTSISSDLP